MSEKSKGKSRNKLILYFLKGTKTFFAVSILSSTLSALADMISPQIIRMAIDNVIKGEPGNYAKAVMRLVNAFGGFEYFKTHIWILALAVMAVALIKVITQYSFRVYNTKGGETLVKNMRDKLFGRIERLPFSWHMKNKTGDIIQRCTSDIDTLRNFISEQMTGIFRIVIMLVMSITFMVSMNPLLTLIAMVPLPIVMWYSFRFHKNVRSEFQLCDENEGKLSAMVQENQIGRASCRERV